MPNFVISENNSYQFTIYEWAGNPDYSASPYGVIINGFNWADMSNHITGSQFDDSISAGKGNDTVFGLGGDDVINGDEGDDIINGGDGNDYLSGGIWEAPDHPSGNDLIHGGNGNDSIFGNDGDDTLYGDEGDDFIEGGTGNDTIYGGTNGSANAGSETIHGGDGDDWVWSGNGVAGDFIYGGSGDDYVLGGHGNDIIDGLSNNNALGNDTISAGAGDDLLYSSDVLAGNAIDNDIFTYYIDGTQPGNNGNDTIFNFYNLSPTNGDIIKMNKYTANGMNFSDLVINEISNANGTHDTNITLMYNGMNHGTIFLDDAYYNNIQDIFLF